MSGVSDACFVLVWCYMVLQTVVSYLGHHYRLQSVVCTDCTHRLYTHTHRLYTDTLVRLVEFRLRNG